MNRGAHEVPPAGALDVLSDFVWSGAGGCVLAIAPDGTVQAVNALLVELLGADPTGGEAAAIIVEEQRAAFGELLAEAGDGWTTRSLCVELGAGPRTDDCRVACHRAGDGWMVVLTPPDAEAATLYGELLRLNEEVQGARRETALESDRLQETVRRLQELDTFKDEILGVVSHDLRAPLTSIVGYAGLLRGLGEPTPEQAASLDAILRATERMERLIGDLLTAAQIQAGRLALELRSVAPQGLVEDAIAAARPSAEQAGVALVAELEDAPVGQYDPARIGQLLDNLISNAIKFSPGAGTVTVTMCTAGPGCVIEVRDTGIGIPAGEIDRLFDRFFRASSATRRRIAGTGLGLSIARAIARAHGGDVTIESEEAVGTTVVVRLPGVAPAPAADPPAG